MAYLKTIALAAVAALAVACKNGASDVGDVAACPATNPRDPGAWIDKMPGMNDNPTLHLTLKFDTPNDGDEYALVFTGADKSIPPTYHYRLDRTKTGNLTVVTEYALHHTEPHFAQPSLRGVKISCGGKPFYEFTKVEETQ
ncbi:MAG: hypothetical protein AB7F91_06115 [Parvularculaceae bacterium]|nr:hypothetical protein [Parvularculaceae bacterium]